MESNEYPSLFAKHMNTKFVPHEAENYHHYPSNVIGANFSGGSITLDTRVTAKYRFPPPKMPPCTIPKFTLRNILL